jgi:hypothetical protein
VTGKKLYSACQLPLIPGFSFMAHNSQSQLLNAATIHLESCATIAASYVMLSGIKCSKDELRSLAILGNINSKNTKKNPESCTAGRNEEPWLKYLAAATLE